MPHLFACLLLSLAPVAATHPNSHSSSRVVVEGRHIELQVRCQSQSLSESIEGLDPNRDLNLSGAELESGRVAIASYMLAHYQLFPDGLQGARLTAKLLDMRTTMASDSAFAEQLLDARFEL